MLGVRRAIHAEAAQKRKHLLADGLVHQRRSAFFSRDQRNWSSLLR